MSHAWLLISFLFHVSEAVLIQLEPAPPFNQRTELVGSGKLEGPEDVIYHSKSKLIYTGCADGWIKRVSVNDSAADTEVKNWVNTGGRPLGFAFGRHNEVIVADPKKGLLNITRQGKVKVLTLGDKVQNFKLIDAVAVAKNGIVYFTEASYKYDLDNYLFDISEGKPHGRLWSYDPTSNTTKVLLRNLFFANGLALSPNQDFLIFCETTKNRCRKYYRRGDKKGRVEDFVDLPSSPDNIHSSGKGHFLISLVMASSINSFLPLENHIAPMYLGANTMNYRAENSTAGVFVVDTNGNITAKYSGPEMLLTSSAVKVGNYIYCGSLVNPYIVRLNLKSSLLEAH